MADKKPAAAPAADAPVKPKLPIIPIVGAAVVSAMLVGGVMFFMMPKAAPTATEGEVAGEGEEAEGEGEGAEPKAEARYVELRDPLVINLSGGGAKFLQVKVQLATRSEPGQKSIETHMPAIQNALLGMLQQATAEELAQPDAMATLQAKALVEANRVLEAQTGKKKVVDQLLFTSFVKQ